MAEHSSRPCEDSGSTPDPAIDEQQKFCFPKLTKRNLMRLQLDLEQAVFNLSMDVCESDVNLAEQYRRAHRIEYKRDGADQKISVQEINS